MEFTVSLRQTMAMCIHASEWGSGWVGGWVSEWVVFVWVCAYVCARARTCILCACVFMRVYFQLSRFMQNIILLRDNSVCNSFINRSFVSVWLTYTFPPLSCTLIKCCTDFKVVVFVVPYVVAIYSSLGFYSRQRNTCLALSWVGAPYTWTR